MTKSKWQIATRLRSAHDQSVAESVGISLGESLKVLSPRKRR